MWLLDWARFQFCSCTFWTPILSLLSSIPVISIILLYINLERRKVEWWKSSMENEKISERTQTVRKKNWKPYFLSWMSFTNAMFSCFKHPWKRKQSSEFHNCQTLSPSPLSPVSYYWLKLLVKIEHISFNSSTHPHRKESLPWQDHQCSPLSNGYPFRHRLGIWAVAERFWCLTASSSPCFQWMTFSPFLISVTIQLHSP